MIGMPKLSLKIRLNLLMLLLSGVALGAFGLMAYESHSFLIKGKEDLVKFSGEAIADKIDRNLFERYGDVQAFAQSEPARSLDRKRIEAFMADMMAAYAPVYDVMIVTDRSGRVVAANQVKKDGQASGLQGIVGRDLSGEPWFKEAVSGNVKPGSAFVEDPRADRDVARVAGGDGLAMNFTSPIRVNGEIVGVWSNRMSWADVVSAIVKEESMKILGERMPEVAVSLRDKEGKLILSSQVPPPAAGAMPKEEERVQASIAFRGYSSYPARGWAATIDVPRQDSQLALNLKIEIVTLVLLLLVNVAGFVFSHRTGLVFERIVQTLFGDSRRVRELSRGILAASQNLASATTQQAAAVEQTVASTEEMRAMLGQTSQQAAACQTAAEGGRAETRSGKAVVLKLREAMAEIQSSNARLDGMVKLISEIREKTNVINEIVTESRLLSFNASIEAARAGAQGKGFAVVAEEVGKLANMSGKAAEEIRALLESSTREVGEAVKITQDRIRTSMQISEECEAAFGKMGNALEKIESSVNLIVSATQEQSQGINQTNTAMAEMDKATQGNSRGAEALAGHAQSMAESAGSLERTIGELSVTVLAEMISAVRAMPPASEAESHAAAAPLQKAPLQLPRATGRAESRWKRA